MSTVSVDEVKRWCRVFHSGDDVLLQDLIDQAEEEAMRFLNRTQPPTNPVDFPGDDCTSSTSEQIPSSEDPAAKSFNKAVCLLVQAAYEMPHPDDQAKMRRNAETVLFPYRTGLGI